MNTDSSINSTPNGESRRLATTVSWLALAIALLFAGWVIHQSVSPDDLLPWRSPSQGLPEVGERAPDFTATDRNGNIVHLSDFEGQPIWLNFWGSWCPPCRAEAPHMVQAYDVLEERGIVLLAVSLEEPAEDAFEYADRVGMDFTILSDGDRQGTRDGYRVRTFPTHIFIDRDGIVRDVVLTTMSVQTALQHAERIS